MPCSCCFEKGALRDRRHNGSNRRYKILCHDDLALCAFDGGEISVSNMAVGLAVKTPHDLALRDVALIWVSLTVQIQAFPDYLVDPVRRVKFHLNTYDLSPVMSDFNQPIYVMAFGLVKRNNLILFILYTRLATFATLEELSRSKLFERIEYTSTPYVLIYTLALAPNTVNL